MEAPLDLWRSWATFLPVFRRLLEGERDVAWDLRDEGGARVADGIYFMRLEVEGRRITRRIAVVH